MNEEQNTVNDDEVVKVSKNVRRIIICVVEKCPFREFSLAPSFRECITKIQSVPFHNQY